MKTELDENLSKYIGEQPQQATAIAIITLNNTIDEYGGVAVDIVTVLQDIHAVLESDNKINRARLDTLLAKLEEIKPEPAAESEPIPAPETPHEPGFLESGGSPWETEPETAEEKITRHKAKLFTDTGALTRKNIIHIVTCAATWLKNDLARAFGCTPVEVPKKMADDMGFPEGTDEPEEKIEGTQ